MLHKDDNHGILIDGDTKIPYYGIMLSPGEAKQIEGKTPKIYEIDGKNIFNIREENGNLIGSKMVYIVFI